MGLAQGETLLTITPAFSNISSSLCTHAVCFKGRVQGFWVIGKLSPVSISTSNKGFFPISPEYVENISLNSVHKSLKAFHWASVISASCNSTFLCISTLAGEVINLFSMFSLFISPSCL